MASEFDLPIVGNNKKAKSEFDLPIATKTTQQTDRVLGSTFELETGTGPIEAPVSTSAPDELPAKKVVSWKELAKDENFNVIQEGAIARWGESGKQKPKESREDYLKRWAASHRMSEWNTTLNAVPDLNWVYNANIKDLASYSKAYQLYKSIPDWYEEGGQPGIRPFAEATFAAVTEPTNILSFGIGAAARYKAARAGIDFAIKKRLAVAGGAAAAESVIGTGQALVEQQLDYETGVRKEINYTEAALSGALSAVFGGAEAFGAFRKPKLGTKQDLEQVLAGRKSPTATRDPDTEKLISAFDAELEDTLNKFDIFEGRKTLDEISSPTGLTQAEIRTDVNRKAIDVAKYVMILDPSFRPKQGQKVSDAVKDLFMSVDAINDAALDASLKKAGITPTEFAQATRTTVADAANIMQGYSSLARVLRRISEIDPEAQKIVDQMYGRDNDVASAMGYLGRGIQRLERESKALVVSSIGTTVRNVMGTGIGITFEGGARAIEGVLYTIGKGIKGAATGTYQRGDLTRGLRNTVKDAFGTLTYLTNAGITAEVTERILKDNPRIQQQLFTALQETGQAELSKVARMANTFNVAQDAFFRRAVFTASVERQMRNVGMDMYKTLADDKMIPADIIKNAADDALKATFSYMPKPQRAGQVTYEAAAEGLGNAFVQMFESRVQKVGIPGSLLVTFPRFMTNAIAFQYKYSPIGVASGVADMLTAAKRFAKDQDGADKLLREGREKMSRGIIGSGALYAAYKYRLENQNTEWYNVQGDDGSTVDTRAVFPIAPYLALGDFVAKIKLGTVDGSKVKEYIESVIGLKVPGGTQGYLIEQIATAFGNTEGKEAERLEIAIGKVLGDFAGRFIQPGQPIFAYFDMFDREAQIVRDPNVIEGEDLVSEAALNRLKGKIPGLKEELPEAKRYLRRETPMRGGEFFNVLTGVRVTPRVNKIEEEFKKLSLDPYTFYGSSGDRVYDRAVIENAIPYVERLVGNFLESDRYNRMTPNQKKKALAENMSDALDVGRTITQAKMTASDRNRVNKLTFNKLPKLERNIINELYAKENNGRTMDEDKAYEQVYKYQARVAGFR